MLRRFAALGMLFVIAAPASAADLDAGRKTYAAICSSCHGIDGNAVLNYAPSFSRGENLDKDNATLVGSVRDGLFRMPPWGGVLSEREIADAVAYSRTLHEGGRAGAAK